ncbi:MAG: acyltransferase [Caldilineaceae bacterium]|nr:acyltransferase [Caldilineaceae bacterium]
MNRQLTALSGLAILLVVLHHTIDLQITWLQTAGVVLPHDWAFYTLIVLHRLGKVAVPLFLFISGSFIAYAARGNPPKLSWHTVQSALRRLIWPYVVWSALFYLLVFFQRHESQSAVGYVKSLAVGYPFHFVPLLIFFYAISVPLAAVAKRYGLALIVLIALYQLFLIIVEYPGTLNVTLPGGSQILSLPILGKTLALWGIYFPLGLVYALNLKRIQPWLQRIWPLLVALTIIFYGLDVLHTAGIVRLPMAVHLYPLTFVMLVPLIKRNWIPQVTQVEYLGKRSYGLYLTHLLVIDLALTAIRDLLPGLTSFPLLIAAPVFIMALAIPLLMMNLLSATPTRVAHPYVFG